MMESVETVETVQWVGRGEMRANHLKHCNRFKGSAEQRWQEVWMDDEGEMFGGNTHAGDLQYVYFKVPRDRPVGREERKYYY